MSFIKASNDLASPKIGEQIYIGYVEDNVDPLNLMRCKIRVEEVYGNIPTRELPYSGQLRDSSVGSSDTLGKSNVPQVGSQVTLVFPRGDYYNPIYTGSIYSKSSIGSFANSPSFPSDNYQTDGDMVVLSKKSSNTLYATYKDFLSLVSTAIKSTIKTLRGILRVASASHLELHANDNINMTSDLTNIHSNTIIYGNLEVRGKVRGTSSLSIGTTTISGGGLSNIYTTGDITSANTITGKTIVGDPVHRH